MRLRNPDEQFVDGALQTVSGSGARREAGFQLPLDIAAMEAFLLHEHMLDPLDEHDDRMVDAALARFIESLRAVAAGY